MDSQSITFSFISLCTPLLHPHPSFPLPSASLKPCKLPEVMGNLCPVSQAVHCTSNSVLDHLYLEFWWLRQ